MDWKCTANGPSIDTVAKIAFRWPERRQDDVPVVPSSKSNSLRSIRSRKSASRKAFSPSEPAKALLAQALSGPAAAIYAMDFANSRTVFNRFGNRNNLGEVLALAL